MKLRPINPRYQEAVRNWRLNGLLQFNRLYPGDNDSDALSREGGVTVVLCRKCMDWALNELGEHVLGITRIVSLWLLKPGSWVDLLTAVALAFSHGPKVLPQGRESLLALEFVRVFQRIDAKDHPIHSDPIHKRRSAMVRDSFTILPSRTTLDLPSRLKESNVSELWELITPHISHEIVVALRDSFHHVKTPPHQGQEGVSIACLHLPQPCAHHDSPLVSRFPPISNVIVDEPPLVGHPAYSTPTVISISDGEPSDDEIAPQDLLSMTALNGEQMSSPPPMDPQDLYKGRSTSLSNLPLHDKGPSHKRKLADDGLSPPLPPTNLPKH
ncbi:hypothetical protein FRB99_003785 [Tulasnella sp. 403]|nr:hypothetical protein FRB99_003785 [Tulasnella sp. 403]